jgi:hypothetical protein
MNQNFSVEKYLSKTMLINMIDIAILLGHGEMWLRDSCTNSIP